MTTTSWADFYLASLEAGRLPRASEIVELARKAKDRLGEHEAEALRLKDPFINGRHLAADLSV